MRDADSILLSLLQTTDELEARRLQDELLLEHAAPVIRQTLRHRMRFYAGSADASLHPPGAEDLFNDVIVKIIERLNELRSQPDHRTIRNFSIYVARIATNVWNDYLRVRRRERHRLKHKLRNLLDRHQDFNVWKEADNLIFCGLAAWGNRGTLHSESVSPDRADEIVERLRTKIFPSKNLREMPLSKIAAETIKLIGHAIELNRLVEIVADLQGIKDQAPESLDAVESGLSQRLPDASPRSDSLIEGRDRLRQYWEEVKKLPTGQRNTICLSFEDESGEDLFSLLVDAGIVTAPELAAEFGLSLEAFDELWMRIPMLDNTELAEYLGVTRQQVSLWRFRAQSRLRKWMLGEKK